ncbi:hypothetical protein ACR0ST_10670 [Aliidiomarina sp. Khilg15.8]
MFLMQGLKTQSGAITSTCFIDYLFELGAGSIMLPLVVNFRTSLCWSCQQPQAICGPIKLRQLTAKSDDFCTAIMPSNSKRLDDLNVLVEKVAFRRMEERLEALLAAGQRQHPVYLDLSHNKSGCGFEI